MQEMNTPVIEIEEDPILIKGESRELRIVAVAGCPYSRKLCNEYAYSSKVGDKIVPRLLAEAFFYGYADGLGFSVKRWSEDDTSHASLLMIFRTLRYAAVQISKIFRGRYYAFVVVDLLACLLEF